ncbi:MAG: ribosome-associated heat shock protein Hsp15 [Paracoccaceae bacterium]|jgi:ribosome-associated heat shock protein Hsp15
MGEAGSKLRLDKWLWHARFFKTRTLAAKQVTAGHVRVDGTRVSKAAFAVSADVVLTFQQEHDVRVIRVIALGTRRGPAAEAQALYEDLSPPVKSARVERVGERPTKKARRALDALRGTN